MNEQLRQLQLTQLEILKLIDKICKKYNLKYSLYAGTMLGAIRHGGFIPWDDDLDICMSRDEYDIFIRVWDNENHEGYILQNKDNETNFTQSFTKIRKDHTTFLQLEREAKLYHTGIFVDIFPIDRCPNGKLRQCIFTFECMLYQLYTREFAPPLNGKVTKVGRMTRFATKVLLLCTPKRARKQMRKKLIKQITKNNDNRELRTVGIQTVHSMRIKYPADMLDSYSFIKFEDAEFMCCSNWKTILQLHYGDYMELPPIEERTWMHPPIILDFEHNYEEL